MADFFNIFGLDLDEDGNLIPPEVREQMDDHAAFRARTDAEWQQFCAAYTEATGGRDLVQDWDDPADLDPDRWGKHNERNTT